MESPAWPGFSRMPVISPTLPSSPHPIPALCSVFPQPCSQPGPRVCLCPQPSLCPSLGPYHTHSVAQPSSVGLPVPTAALAPSPPQAELEPASSLACRCEDSSLSCWEVPTPHAATSKGGGMELPASEAA